MIDWNRPVQVYHEGGWHDAKVVYEFDDKSEAILIYKPEYLEKELWAVMGCKAGGLRNTPAPPKLVPFTAKTLPKDAWYRPRNQFNGEVYKLIGWCNNEFGTASKNCMKRTRYEEAIEEWQYSTDLGKTWQPCGVMEVQT
jgi:hypothetical protein